MGWFFKRKKKKDKTIFVVQNGVDVERYGRGGEKGDLFMGASGGDATYVIDGNRRNVHKIDFTDEVSGEKYYVHFKENMGIGRAERMPGLESFLSIQSDFRISRFHCVLYADNGKIYLKDAGSRNHTELNGEKIQEPLVLKKDDVIRVGNTRLRVRI